MMGLEELQKENEELKQKIEKYQIIMVKITVYSNTLRTAFDKLEKKLFQLQDQIRKGLHV